MDGRQGIVFHSRFSITIRRVERSSPPPPAEPSDLALRDDLTGAWNRRYLRQLLGEDWASLVTTQGTITLLALDLDFFKEINDSHGHGAGDLVLQQASNQLRASFRAEDRLIRYGGDEFVVALFGAGAEEARALAERARSALATVEIGGAPGAPPIRLPLSFSMGVASFPEDGGTGEEVLAVADRRLYEEKRARKLPATAGTRGRRRLLFASGLAVVAIAALGWLEWRRLRAAPPPPPLDGIVAAQPAEAPPPLAEIVVRDEAELIRLREEVKRLQAALAQPRPSSDRGRDEARIRELEARLQEAGDERLPAAAPLLDDASSRSGSGVAGALENPAGMQIGERRLREAGDPSPAPGASQHEPVLPNRGAAERLGAVGAGGRVEPPQLLRAIRPAYPPMARLRRRMATVELRVRVDATGKVVEVAPEGPPAGFGFDESAREAALSARFRPGTRDGQPVEMETRLAIRFLLEGPPR